MAISSDYPVGTLPQQMVEELSKTNAVPYVSHLDPDKFVAPSYNSTAEIRLMVQADGASRALNRAAYERTSFHSPVEFTLQVSNFPTPGEDDWYDIATSVKFASTDVPCKWVRVKAAAGSFVYVQSARYLYE